jgi:hypothetical protein
MPKIKLPRGSYLDARINAANQIVFRWGNAPGFRK